jgi:hypothetical protein
LGHSTPIRFQHSIRAKVGRMVGTLDVSSPNINDARQAASNASVFVFISGWMRCRRSTWRRFWESGVPHSLSRIEKNARILSLASGAGLEARVQ